MPRIASPRRLSDHVAYVISVDPWREDRRPRLRARVRTRSDGVLSRGETNSAQRKVVLLKGRLDDADRLRADTVEIGQVSP